MGMTEKERMTANIKKIVDGNPYIGISELERALNYSSVHLKRVFKDVTGKNLGEYMRLLKLTAAAKEIAGNDENILDIALTHNYDSHEGFTKAFSSAFGISPTAHRKGEKPIRYFIPYPVNPKELIEKGENNMIKNTVCTVTVVDRPKRKLIYLPSKTGKDYWSFCQEMGCDWEGLLMSVKDKFDAPAFLTLNSKLIPTGSDVGAAGVEVPLDYAGEIPEGYLTVELPEGKLMYFQSEPFEDENDFGEAIGLVFKAYENYKPENYGYEFDLENAPLFNFGAATETGAKIAVPVRRKQ